MSVTLDDLQTRALLRAEMPLDTQRYESGELTNYINSSMSELYDILVTSQGIDYFLDAYYFSTAASIIKYPLPENFYKFAGLDLRAPNDKYYTLTRFSHSDRLRYQNATEFFVDGIPRYRYRVADGYVSVLPAPEASYDCVLHFVPQVTELVNSSDTVKNTIVEGWLEFIEIDVAIKLLEKDEDLERAMGLKQTKNALIQRIMATARRDIEVPEVEPDSGNTLFNLRIQARYKADMLGVSSSLISDRELTHYINRSREELHDLLIKAYDNNYFLDAYQFTTSTDRQDYNLPTDFYKLGGVDIEINGTTYSLQNYNFAERNYYDNSTVAQWNQPVMHYQLQRNSLRIAPVPAAGYGVTIWYSKQASALVNDTDKLEDTIINGWVEFITTDAAIKMLNKSLLSVRAESLQGVQLALQNLMGQKSALIQRIEVMAENRNWGQPQKMVDAGTLNGDW